MAVTYHYGVNKAAFGFEERELSLFHDSIFELIAYHEDWLNDNREDVVKDSKMAIKELMILADKVYHYRCKMLDLLDKNPIVPHQEEEDEEWMREEEEDPCLCVEDHIEVNCPSCF
jgi:hypothetical protein